MCYKVIGDLMNYLDNIKELIEKDIVLTKKHRLIENNSTLITYFEIGRLIVEAQGGEKRAKSGDGLIKEYSKKLIEEIGKGYSTRNLRSMRQFYLIFKDEIWQTVSAKLSWSHIIELVWIKNKEYERLSIETKEKLKSREENKVTDFIKNLILIKNSYDYVSITEKILKQIILEDLDNFMKELGNGFCYIENEYKIKIGNRYNYIDLLLYNIKYNCYVVVELKVTELKKEHIGQIQTYMNYIDKNLKNINQDKTIGIIICKKDNQFIMEYCSDDRIYQTTYELINL